ncbi:hypothetical protein KM043_014892 [Ampulex compressa]|nr:hypothetical protein KM043_014892 [Ampulex compressa]
MAAIGPRLGEIPFEISIRHSRLAPRTKGCTDDGISSEAQLREGSSDAVQIRDSPRRKEGKKTTINLSAGRSYGFQGADRRIPPLSYIYCKDRDSARRHCQARSLIPSESYRGGGQRERSQGARPGDG